MKRIKVWIVCMETQEAWGPRLTMFNKLSNIRFCSKALQKTQTLILPKLCNCKSQKTKYKNEWHETTKDKKHERNHKMKEIIVKVWMGNKSSVSKNAKCQSKELYFDVSGQIWQIILLNEKIFDIQKLIWKTN